MNRPHRLLGLWAACCAAACLGTVLAGCGVEKPPKPVNRYPTEPLRKVPPFMHGTLYEMTNLKNDSPFPVSGFGLVVNLNGTGGSEQVSNVVKAFMGKQLEAKGFGSKLNPQFEHVSPESVLHDKNAAIVEVMGLIPPGARKGQFFDVRVRAEGREVTSLARGQLYESQLTINGANSQNPPPVVNVWATAWGPVFVNPAYALGASAQGTDARAKQSLRSGTIIGGGQVSADRPLLLGLRQPENRLARAIEARVNDYFHRDKVCTAFDMGYCQLWVPPEYEGDWEHFSKLVLHMYLQGSSEAFARAKARELVAEARKPGAPLQDISYCWEGLGTFALPELAPLLADPSAPQDLRFAAARAAAYIGDPSGAAERALYDLAMAGDSDFQVPAVQVLGRIPNSRAINRLLRDLLDSEKSTVRIEAYSILSRPGVSDPAVQSQVIASNHDSRNQKFVLDFVHSHGKPLIYATRSGIPRIAIFGDVPQLALPLTFGAMDNHLTISSGPVGRDVTIFYRDAQLAQPVQMSSPPDLADVLARLGGQMDEGAGSLDFTYAEILAILQGLSDQQKLRVMQPTGEEVAAAFMMQDVSVVGDAIDNAPSLERGRPQGDQNAPRLDVPLPPAPGGEKPAPTVGEAPQQQGVAPAATALRKQ